MSTRRLDSFLPGPKLTFSIERDVCGNYVAEVGGHEWQTRIVAESVITLAVEIMRVVKSSKLHKIRLTHDYNRGQVCIKCASPKK